MAVIKAVSSKAGIGQALDYVTKEEKTEDKLVSGLHCEPDTVKDEMAATKELWGKTGGRTYKHFVQSYHEDEHITPEQAHQNAVELAKGTEAWKGHEVLIATHIDRGHIHTHFIVNSVNFEDGHKLQWSKADLQNLKDRCNEQSRQQGLHVPEKGKTFSGDEREETVAWNKETYNLLKQAEKGEVKSYVQDTALAVMDCRETATSREDFIDQMKARGYGVDWQDSHKYITFIDLERQSQGEKQCKVRNNKLEKYYAVDFGKESLEHGFEINARREAERTATTERARQQLDRTAIPENNGTGTPNIGAFINQLNADERASEEKRDKDVLEYADVLETHTFENDIKYIEASKTNLDKWTIEELLCAETPFLSMNDITDNDWQILDFKLEKYDRANENYDLKECKILAFVLQQIHYDKTNFIKVPNFIRNGRKFQELVVKYNPELTNILFPTRASN